MGCAARRCRGIAGYCPLVQDREPKSNGRETFELMTIVLEQGTLPSHDPIV